MVDKFHGTALALQFDALDPSAARPSSRPRHVRASVRDVIAEGVARKVFRPVDPKLTTFAILGAMNWLARWYRAGGGSSVDDIGEAFAALFLAGLLAK